MKIIKVVKNLEDGSVEATLKLTEDQTMYLLNFALGFLVQTGMAEIVEQNEEGAATEADTELETEVGLVPTEASDPVTLN